MSIKTLAIQSFSKYMLGSSVFDKIKDVVKVYQNTTLTSKEKREQAFKDIEDAGLELSSWAINLGIELAVGYLTHQTLSK